MFYVWPLYALVVCRMLPPPFRNRNSGRSWRSTHCAGVDPSFHPNPTRTPSKLLQLHIPDIAGIHFHATTNGGYTVFKYSQLSWASVPSTQEVLGVSRSALCTVIGADYSSTCCPTTTSPFPIPILFVQQWHVMLRRPTCESPGRRRHATYTSKG